MKRIHIFCEGQTEEEFSRELLYDHFFRQNININPIVVRTSKRRAGKGGVVTYGKIKKQIDNKCKEDKSSYVTTMLDFYAFPKDFPDIDRIKSSNPNSFQQAIALEEALQSNIQPPNFIANFMIHEFEGILFSKPAIFDTYFENTSSKNLAAVIAGFESPEHINDDPRTAPSKRILKHYPKYQKVVDGTILALDIGLDTIRSKCPHFKSWIEKLEALGGQ